MRFALNHIAAPQHDLGAFFAMARALGLTEVEIRNDLPDVLSDLSPADVRAQAANAGVTVISVNALYPFNVWSGDLPARALAMADYAAACGAKALVMCPLNDGRAVAFDALCQALAEMQPLLEARGLIGLVEPLGFPVSSLRSKAEAIRAIDAVDGAGRFKLVHDTFHHHLAGETEVFAEWTGLVHISGVDTPKLGVPEMLDGHRILVGQGDRLENLHQIKTLLAAGYEGPFSFEPFAASVQQSANVQADLAASMGYILDRL